MESEDITKTLLRINGDYVRRTKAIIYALTATMQDMATMEIQPTKTTYYPTYRVLSQVRKDIKILEADLRTNYHAKTK